MSCIIGFPYLTKSSPNMLYKKRSHYLICKKFRDFDTLPAIFHKHKLNFKYTKNFQNLLRTSFIFLILNFYILLQLFNYNRINRWHHCGPDISLDTKVWKNRLMSYLYVISIIWHQNILCHMRRMTTKIWCWPNNCFKVKKKSGI